jgi:hypothetical protein
LVARITSPSGPDLKPLGGELALALFDLATMSVALSATTEKSITAASAGGLGVALLIAALIG